MSRPSPTEVRAIGSTSVEQAPAALTAETARELALAVSYLRVSTKEQAEKGGQDEGFSIPAQRQANAHKAAAIGARIVAEFVDAGESAKSADRPDLQRMIAYVKAHRVAYCIVHKVDRLARNLATEVVKGMTQKAATGGTPPRPRSATSTSTSATRWAASCAPCKSTPTAPSWPAGRSRRTRPETGPSRNSTTTWWPEG